MKTTTRLNGVRMPAGARSLLVYLAQCEDSGSAPNLRGMGRALSELRKRRLLGRESGKVNAKGRKVLARLGGQA